MKRLGELWGAHWRLWSSIAGCVAIVGFLLLYKLSTLVLGLSQTEQSTLAFSGSWHHWAHNPLYAPHAILQWTLQAVTGHHGALVGRLPSVFFGSISVMLFAYILRRWYGVRTATFGTIMFACSAWLLHSSRFAGPDVLYIWSVLMLLALHIAWERHKHQALMPFVAALACAAILYVPGMLWILGASFILLPHHFSESWTTLSRWWQRALWIGAFLILMAPLLAAIVSEPGIGKTWLGLPATFGNPGQVPHRLAESITFFVWRGPLRPDMWLDRLPLLNAFATAMAVLGTLFYARHITAPRTRLLATFFILGAIFFALGGPVPIDVLVPIVYIVISGGVGYLLHEWLHVFPRNPLARTTGYVLMSLIILLSCVYNLRTYFVAWPHNTATKAAFHKPPHE